MNKLWYWCGALSLSALGCFVGGLLVRDDVEGVGPALAVVGILLVVPAWVCGEFAVGRYERKDSDDAW